jgi:predicted metallopeptidase
MLARKTSELRGIASSIWHILQMMKEAAADRNVAVSELVPPKFRHVELQDKVFVLSEEQQDMVVRKATEKKAAAESARTLLSFGRKKICHEIDMTSAL